MMDRIAIETASDPPCDQKKGEVKSDDEPLDWRCEGSVRTGGNKEVKEIW